MSSVQCESRVERKDLGKELSIDGQKTCFGRCVNGTLLNGNDEESDVRTRRLTDRDRKKGMDHLSKKFWVKFMV